MQKKTRLRIKLKKGESPKVKKGDRIKSGDRLAETSKIHIYEFNLAKTLGVAPLNLSKYLLVKEQNLVKKGDSLAKKGGLLSKNIIKTPVSGTFIWVDRQLGIVGIQSENITELPLTSWFDGEVEDVTPEIITVSVNGIPLSGTDGKGGPATGKLLVFTEKLNVFTLPTEIDTCVIAVREAPSDMIAKADALGAIAIITEKIEEPPFTLPYLLVENIEILSKYKDMTVIVHGLQKELLVIENERNPSKT